MNMKTYTRPTPDAAPLPAAVPCPTAGPAADRAGGTDGVVVHRATQSNHHATVVPSCLGHLPPMPLYLLVAHWALLTGTVLCWDVVSAAFRVEPRRARELLRYLTRYETPVTFRRLSSRPVRLLILSVPDAAPTQPR